MTRRVTIVYGIGIIIREGETHGGYFPHEQGAIPLPEVLNRMPWYSSMQGISMRRPAGVAG